MKDFAIISDGACDLADEVVSKLGIRVVPFYVAYDEEKYLKEKLDFSVQEFYQKLIDHPDIFPKTSMPTAEDYLKEFEEAYAAEKDVLCVTISKKFSGSLNSALMARDMFLDEHPDARIEVLDSILLSCPQGLLVREIVRMKENGLSLDEVLKKAEELKNTGRCYFTINGLSYLQRGGRIGKLTSVVGNILKVAPLIVAKNGEIQSGGLALSRKRAIMKILDKFKTTLSKYNL
ncbi:MAG: DegV family protein, partial [Anaeroplasmataceae bacterium]|nr:DegV family protein [Anaeroplasmataceae bacterium]